ncbi:MAG: putative colanic acid biosynthesis acetyltransferase [Rikenellaceae bacterium]
MSGLDIKENRRVLNYPLRIYLKRILWSFAGVFFRCSPRTAFGYRNMILRLFGAKIGKHVHIYPSVKVWFPWNLEIGDWSAIGEETLIYNLGRVVIGTKATISHRSHLCAGTHDYTSPSLPLLRYPIYIGDQTWICANTFVGSGITIHEGAVIGAGAVVTRDVAAWGVYGGNPAKYIKKRVIRDEKY